VPPEHTWPDGHAFPHAPQLAGSLEVLTHALPHLVVPPEHWSWHAPAEQT
jgi:hypothetical protein